MCGNRTTSLGRLLFTALSRCPRGSRAFPSHVHSAAYTPRSHLFVVCRGPTGFSWFKLVFGIAYMTFGFYCLVLFFRARHVFEIRARLVWHCYIDKLFSRSRSSQSLVPPPISLRISNDPEHPCILYLTRHPTPGCPDLSTSLRHLGCCCSCTRGLRWISTP